MARFEYEITIWEPDLNGNGWLFATYTVDDYTLRDNGALTFKDGELSHTVVNVPVHITAKLK